MRLLSWHVQCLEPCHAVWFAMHQSLLCCHSCRALKPAVLSDLQYTKFIKNGWTILDTTQDDRTLAAMYQHEDSSTEIAVVTTNTGTSSTTTNWNFGSTSPLQYTVEVYRTSSSENCAQVADTLLPTSGNLQYDLPAQSITTFHFTFVAESTISAVATAG